MRHTIVWFRPLPRCCITLKSRRRWQLPTFCLFCAERWIILWRRAAIVSISGCMTSVFCPVSACSMKMRSQDLRSNIASWPWFREVRCWSVISLPPVRPWSTVCVMWQIFTVSMEQNSAILSCLPSVAQKELRSWNVWPRKSVNTGRILKVLSRYFTKVFLPLIRIKVYPVSTSRMWISTGRAASLHRNSDAKPCLCAIRYLKNVLSMMVVHAVTRSMSM